MTELAVLTVVNQSPPGAGSTRRVEVSVVRNASHQFDTGQRVDVGPGREDRLRLGQDLGMPMIGDDQLVARELYRPSIEWGVLL